MAKTATTCTRCDAPCDEHEATEYDEGIACPACDAELLEMATDGIALLMAEDRFDWAEVSA